MTYGWLTSRLVCKGRVIRSPLNPSNLTSKDLPDICLRMHLILDSVEFVRSEGRLVNRGIFESIDTLYSDLLHKNTNDLDDWRDCIERFGDYYELAGRQTIEVSPDAVRNHGQMFDELKISRVDE